MDIPQSRFKAALDSSPFGPTVVVEVYSREENPDLGYLRELESLTDMKQRSPEELVFECEAEEYEFRFELESDFTNRYEAAFEHAVHSHEPSEYPVNDPLYVIELHEMTDMGLETEVARYDGEVPGYLITAFSQLHSTAYQNMID